jgi:hypothetical protein
MAWDCLDFWHLVRYLGFLVASPDSVALVLAIRFGWLLSPMLDGLRDLISFIQLCPVELFNTTTVFSPLGIPSFLFKPPHCVSFRQINWICHDHKIIIGLGQRLGGYTEARDDGD